MDRREKYLFRVITKFTERRKHCDQHKTEDTRQSEGEKRRKRKSRVASSDRG